MEVSYWPDYKKNIDRSFNSMRKLVGPRCTNARKAISFFEPDFFNDNRVFYIHDIEEYAKSNVWFDCGGVPLYIYMYEDIRTYEKGYIALPHIRYFRCFRTTNERMFETIRFEGVDSGPARIELEKFDTVEGYVNREKTETKIFDCYSIRVKADGKYKMPRFDEVCKAIEIATSKLEKDPEFAEVIKKQRQEDGFFIKYGDLAFKFNEAKDNLSLVKQKADGLKDNIDSSILLSVAKELADAENRLSMLKGKIDEFDKLLLKIEKDESLLKDVNDAVKRIKSEFATQTIRTPEILRDYAQKLAQYELQQINVGSELDTDRKKLQELKAYGGR